MADDLNKPAFYPRVGNIRPQPRSPLQQAEMRERPLDAAMGALKRVLDEGSRILDANKATPFDVTRGLVNAIPFAGPQLAKQFEQSNVSVPVGMSIDSRSPGIETFDMPTKDLMDAMKWSDLVGTSGASRAAESLGYGESPDFFDALDAMGVGAGVAGAAKMAPKAARAAKQGAKGAANLVGNAINDAMVYNQGPLAAITPQPMRMFIGPQAKTYDVGRAMKAEEMLKAGASPEEVWKATGTMIGKDGIPRQEISDASSMFRDTEALKQLKDAYKDIIAINKERIKPDRSGQKDMFPKQLTEARKPVREGIASLKEDLREIDKNPRTQGVAAKWTLEHPELYRAYPQLADINVTQKPTIGAEKGSLSTLGGVIQNLEVKDIKDPRSVALHEMQHAIQGIEGMGAGANPMMAFTTPEWRQMFESYKKAELAGLPKGSTLSTKDEDRLAQKAANRWYQLQHGEAEARATQARKDLMPQQRLESFPHNDFDVNPDETLIRKGVPFLGVSKQSAVVPDDLKRLHEEFRIKAEQDKALLDAYNKATRNVPLNERPTLDEFRATNVQPSQAELDQMRLELEDRNMAGDDDVRMSAAGSAADAVRAARTAKAAKAAKIAEEAEKALPAVLPRAPAKTKEQIRPYAQKMSEMMEGKFVRPDPKKSINPAGKSMSQWKMEQELEHDIGNKEGVNLTPQQVADIEKQLGMLKIGISGDTSISDKILRRAGQYEMAHPVEQEGGPLYGLKGHPWASNYQALKNLQTGVNELSAAHGDAPVLGQYMQMGPEGTNFAQHFADANLQAIDTSKMKPSQIESFNKLIREGNDKSGAHPEFPGIEDPYGAYFYFSFYPELRKHFNALMTSPTYTSSHNLPDGRVILHAITEPELRDLPVTTTGFAQYPLQTGFSPEGLPLAEHGTYTHKLPKLEGAEATRMKYPMPAEIDFPDVYDYALNVRKYRPRDLTRVFQTATPRQIIDPQHVDEIKMYEELMKEYTGKKKGGQVKMAEGGDITAEDLEIEERPL